MYDINVTTQFDAVHCLRGYPEDFEVPHNHTWKVVVTVRATTLDELGMGIDFLVLDKLMKDVITPFEGQDLNEHAAFQTINPSTEYIAKYIYDRMEPALRTDRYKLYSVSVSETDTQNVIYYGEDET
ncbi:MAG: 6-carboxytetrahydropterin synthase [Alphaproteobacteria bacterium]|nr:6-carboxytetrahydropterin synthase [Alphaproteobacteria bacterium]